MVYHLGDAAYVKAYTRCAAAHGFGDGVGQVVLKAGRKEDIGSIVEQRHRLFASRTEARRANAFGQGNLFRVLAHDDEMDGFVQPLESP